MALEYVGGKTVTGTTTLTVGLTDLSGGLATEPSPGDYVIIAAGTVSNDVRTLALSASNPEFTELATRSFDSSARDSGILVVAKFHETGDPSTVSFTGGLNTSYGSVAAVHVWRGVDTDSPMDTDPVTAAGGNTRNMDPPAISPVTQGAQIVVAGCGTSTANFNSTTVPSGFTNKQFVSYDPGTACGTGLASREWDGVTVPYNPPNWGSTGGTTGDSFCSVTMALRPAPEVVPTGVQLRHYASGAWQPAKPLKRWDGAAWVEVTGLKYHDGSQWGPL